MGLGRPGRDIADALRFFTRLPLGEPRPGAPLDIDRIAWAAPVAGVVVGLIGAHVLGLATLLGLPLLFRGGLATAALVLATGALHEDGLADVADGFGDVGEAILVQRPRPKTSAAVTATKKQRQARVARPDMSTIRPSSTPATGRTPGDAVQCRAARLRLGSPGRRVKKRGMAMSAAPSP